MSLPLPPPNPFSKSKHRHHLLPQELPGNPKLPGFVFLSAFWKMIFSENLCQTAISKIFTTPASRTARPRMPEDPVIGRLPLYELNCIARQVTLSMSCAALHHCLSTALLFPTELHGIIVPPCSFTVQFQQLWCSNARNCIITQCPSPPYEAHCPALQLNIARFSPGRTEQHIAWCNTCNMILPTLELLELHSICDRWDQFSRSAGKGGIGVSVQLHKRTLLCIPKLWSIAVHVPIFGVHCIALHRWF